MSQASEMERAQQAIDVALARGWVSGEGWLRLHRALESTTNDRGQQVTGDITKRAGNVNEAATGEAKT